MPSEVKHKAFIVDEQATVKVLKGNTSVYMTVREYEVLVRSGVSLSEFELSLRESNKQQVDMIKMGNRWL